MRGYKIFSDIKISRLIFILFFILIVNSEAQIENLYNFKQFAKEGEDLVEQPLNWKAVDWLKFGAIISGAYGIMQIDEDAQFCVQKNPNSKFSFPVEFGRIWGEPFFSVLFGAAFFLQGTASGNSANLELGFEIEQSLFYTLWTTGILKISLGRTRPYMDKGAFSFSPFSYRFRDRSMPSGHTSSAFSLSTVLAENSEKDILKVVYYLPAFLTAFSRVYQNYHWASDVFLGAVTGIFIAKFFNDIHEEQESLPQVPEPLIKISIGL